MSPVSPLPRLHEKWIQTGLPFITAAELMARQAALGCPTGISELDAQLQNKGLPRGKITLFAGAPGTGKTSTWLSTAFLVAQQKKKSAWLDFSNTHLFPLTWMMQSFPLDSLFVVQSQWKQKIFVSLLQQILDRDLFSLIGVSLEKFCLSQRLLFHLQHLVEKSKSTVVLLSEDVQALRTLPLSSLAVVIEFKSTQWLIKKNQNRPSPIYLQRSFQHAPFLSEFSQRQLESGEHRGFFKTDASADLETKK